jgi:hypothetical protein
MLLVFIYEPVASGKLTIARELAGRTGLPLFHNHSAVDAVETAFPSVQRTSYGRASISGCQ